MTRVSRTQAAGLAFGLGVGSLLPGMLMQSAQATFPGANGRIAYVAGVGKAGSTWTDIFSVRTDGSDRRRLTFMRHASNPTWSPTGRRLAFQRGGAVLVMRAAGANKRKVMAGELVGWMPDGDRLLIRTAGTPGATWHLYRLSTHTVADLPLVIPATEADGWQGVLAPTLSPRGDRIVFLRSKLEEGSDGYEDRWHALFTVRLDGSDFRRLGQVRAPIITGVGWSPNGGQLSYAWENPREEGAGVRGRCDGTGMGSVRLNGTSGTARFDRACGQRFPAWSPSGGRIVLETDGANPARYRPGLRVTNLDGTGVKLLVRLRDGHRSDPDWQPLHRTG